MVSPGLQVYQGFQENPVTSRHLVPRALQGHQDNQASQVGKVQQGYPVCLAREDSMDSKAILVTQV